MKTKKVVETNIEEMEGMDFFYYHNDPNGWFMNNKESIEKSVKEYGEDFLPKVLFDINQAFQFLAETIVGPLSKDLKDIWERMDKLEKNLPK